MRMKPHITAAVAAVLLASDAPAQDDALAHVQTDLVGAGLEEGYLMPGHGYQSVIDYEDWFLDGQPEIET